jgi:molybdopterin-guanine dinucleotide biosynthesis protein A
MLHHPIRRLAEVSSEILVVIPPEADELDLPADVSVRLVRDEEPFGGPLAGLAAALAETRTELALVVAGDMPELQARVLLVMLARAEEPRIRAVALEERDAIRPLPCVLRVEPARASASDLLEAGGTSLRELLAELEVTSIPGSEWERLDPRRRTLVDVDRPEDLETGSL